jgi:hypothetical protein
LHSVLLFPRRTAHCDLGFLGRPISREYSELAATTANEALPSPQALIIPARSHAEVIVAAVAARDVKRAQVYAKKYGIPIVHKMYDGESDGICLLGHSLLKCLYCTEERWLTQVRSYQRSSHRLHL